MGKVLLGRDAILAIDDRSIEEVEVPEWGGTVRVRGMTAGERDGYEQSMVRVGKNNKVEIAALNARARIVSLCVIDEDGNQVFSETDIPAIERKAAAAIERIFNKARELSGLTQRDMDELVGKSETTQPAASSSGSALRLAG